MNPPADTLPQKSRLRALLEHFAQVEDPRDVRRILHPLNEVGATLYLQSGSDMALAVRFRLPSGWR